MSPHVEYDAIALGLPREARAGGAECYALLGAPCVIEHFARVLDVVGDHDSSREQAIRAGVGGVADEIDRASQHAICAQEVAKIIAQLSWCAGSETLRRAVALRCSRWSHDGADIRCEEGLH
jgi:hypothetical protein